MQGYQGREREQREGVWPSSLPLGLQKKSKSKRRRIVPNINSNIYNYFNEMLFFYYEHEQLT
jgi:hypothetical protein